MRNQKRKRGAGKKAGNSTRNQYMVIDSFLLEHRNTTSACKEQGKESPGTKRRPTSEKKREIPENEGILVDTLTSSAGRGGG